MSGLASPASPGQRGRRQPGRCYLEMVSRSHKALIAVDADGANLLMRTTCRARPP
ncbi:hypothetical protein [Streptomyces pseudogriseolus]|uniref:hypothetical protein n=1 Tax=Streptomyces pseudogriseolus TaxID=36817 RepID=UPI003FA29490